MSQSQAEGSSHGEIGPPMEHGEKLCDSVYLFHEPEGQAEVEIVFIHGLSKSGSGDSTHAYWTTWLARDGSQDNCWPMTWLAATFPKARVLSISYDASDALSTPSSGSMNLFVFGEKLAQEMVLPTVDIGQNGCPVVFVCHCLGGLIAKQIVVWAHRNSKGDKRIEKLLQKTKAFVFYGTPHGRSKLINADSETDIGRLNNEFERIQREVYKNKWRFRVVAETHATSTNWLSSSMIVEEPSARHVGYDVMHVAADHFDVCKPESKSDTCFLYLTGRIEEVVAEYKSNQAKISGLPSVVVDVDAKLVELREKSKRKPIVGLVGMGGVGKTTLSKIFYSSEREQYERCSYLEDVKSHSSIVGFQKQLLRELCDEIWDDNEDSKNYLWKIQQCIRTKKVLVVIDDIGTKQNLNALHVLAFQNGSSGSRLVITCRDRAILTDYMSEGERIEVDGLDKVQSKKLFSHHTSQGFNAVHVIGKEERDKFDSEALKIVDACGGLPLSIEVIGQHLQRQNHLPGEERLAMWKEALKRLQEAMAFDGHHNEDERLWRKLRISYDDLGDMEKGFFLDFACILCEMKDMDMNTIIRIWDSRGGLQTLIDSSLLKVASNQWPAGEYGPYGPYQMKAASSTYVKTIVIHDQLRDMGRWIARGSGQKGLHKQTTHMWERSEVQQFLRNNEASSTLEGLSLVNVQRVMLHKPRVLGAFTHGICLSHHIHLYPNLRLLNLSQASKSVVKKVLETSDLQNMSWLSLDETRIRTNHLKIFSAKSKTLHVLHMQKCWKVLKLPSSIGDLSSLKELNLRGCRQLRTLPKSIGKLGNLEVLILRGCDKLKKLPESMGDLKLLKLLNLRKCRNLEAIPTGVGKMVKLESLDLTFCENMHTMCEFDTTMQHLHTLVLYGCSCLKSFKSLGNLNRLRALNLGCCEALRIPNLAESVGQLHELQQLHLGFWNSMQDVVAEAVEHVGDLVSLRDLSLPGCSQLVKLPSSLGRLSQLRSLDLRLCTKLERLPECLELLTQLRYLDLGSCEKLERLPECLGLLTQLRSLDLSCCEKLERLPECLGLLTQLRSLDLGGCEELERLPECLGLLTQLRSLHLSLCTKLHGLPDSFLGLTQLSKLYLVGCTRFKLKEEVRYALIERGCEIIGDPTTVNAQ